MKYYSYLILASVFLTISGCSSEPEENTTLSDYKERQLDKAKAVEDEMNKRVDTINKQLEPQNQEKDDDTQ
ncbi:hypothetical protein [Kangiella geojedonensis]|uniref:Lipoprotein n=1 Tax=Kangiella geojedonensis TaxID=914150 RepID=A0A0F6TRP9_9GAMM|nr:hypothetical protein [Kangiella geojedonensis]AKE52805.1 hypothetical protein TQ33_1869 [Kangiella geojedonensis]